MTEINRHELLKLSGAAALGAGLPRLFSLPARQPLSGTDNVLIVVYDAFSAGNISLYGYPRHTTPHIDDLASRATIYHRHRAPGNYTTPGTASLLTGVYPWTHRAINFNEVVTSDFNPRSFFHAFENHFRMAYSHNILANTLLSDFAGDISRYTPRQTLFLQSDAFIEKIFPHDNDIANLGWIRSVKQLEGLPYYSFYLSTLYRLLNSGRLELLQRDFPRGLPYINVDNYFILEDGTDFLAQSAMETQQPFMGYFHFLPPHHPYNTRQEYYGVFDGDGFSPPGKPEHLFTNKISAEELFTRRTAYDEYIRYVDAEFARLYRGLQDTGVLENTWLVLTSDHGEIFERGLSGHNNHLLYEPLVHIPLLIFEPGQSKRVDVYENTSAVDLLPTLMHLTGQEQPAWTEGRLLPPYGQGDDQRDIYSLQALGTGQQDSIDKATVTLVRGRYKLIYYFGYAEIGDDRQLIELYDLQNDPEEMVNIAKSSPDVASELLAALNSKLDQVNSSVK